MLDWARTLVAFMGPVSHSSVLHAVLKLRMTGSNGESKSRNTGIGCIQRRIEQSQMAREGDV